MYEEKEPKKKEKKEKAKKVYTEKNIKSKVKQTKEEKKESAKEETTKKDTKTTNKVMSFKADWTGIFIKFAIFLLIAFFIIFAVTKIKNLTGSSFAKNLNKMKEAATKYFDEENNRPSSLDEEISLSLEDMINSNMISELKDKGSVCSKEYSYASLTKKENEKYNLEIYLTCGGKSEKVNYDLNYNEEAKDETEKTTLYELQRTVKKDKYTCPEGYLVAGKYCVGEKTTETIAATVKYNVTPERNTPAIHKSSTYSYEKIYPEVTTTLNSYTCPEGYIKNGDKCEKYLEAQVKNVKSYTCPSGSILSGSLCVYTATPTKSDNSVYCKTGTLVNGNSCYVAKNAYVKCSTGSYDRNNNTCYTKYVATKSLSDWLFDSQVTYKASVTLKNTTTTKYEKVGTDNNGYNIYKKYIKKYVANCNDGDELVGNSCRHYDSSLEQKSCATGYTLNKDKTECYKLTKAINKSTATKYTCPNGYKKKTIDGEVSCTRYVASTKQTIKKYTCTKGYELTSDNECVKTTEATKVDEEISYSCPEGYTKKGSGDKTRCYKKVSTADYYYCANKSATLSGTRCIIPAKTRSIKYTCPSGYKLSGTTCYKETRKESILAEVNDPNVEQTETIWSKEKDVEGWTFTGNTKEE